MEGNYRAVLFAVVAVIVDFTLSLFQVSESSGNAMVCLQKDRDTSVPFSVTVTPFETPPFLEGTFQARGEKTPRSCFSNLNFHKLLK